MEKAFRLYSESAQKNGINAFVIVQDVLVRGYFIASNESKCVKFLQKAAEGRHLDALDLLAHFYRNGTGEGVLLF